jgi:hypothetical protein
MSVQNFDRPIQCSPDEIAYTWSIRRSVASLNFPSITAWLSQLKHGMSSTFMGNTTQFFVHAVSKHHAASRAGSLDKVLRGSGGKMIEKALLC